MTFSLLHFAFLESLRTDFNNLQRARIDEKKVSSCCRNIYVCLTRNSTLRSLLVTLFCQLGISSLRETGPGGMASHASLPAEDGVWSGVELFSRDMKLKTPQNISTFKKRIVYITKSLLPNKYNRDIRYRWDSRHQNKVISNQKSRNSKGEPSG